MTTKYPKSDHRSTTEPGRPRRQHRSCDPCRKGKRACDGEAPEGLHSSNVRRRSPCSNCKRWRKDCTYSWLYTARATPRELRKGKPKQTTAAAGPGPPGADAVFPNSFYQPPLNCFPQVFANDPTLPFDTTGLNPSLSSSSQSRLTSNFSDGSSLQSNASGPGLWDTTSILDDLFRDGTRCADPTPGGACGSLGSADSVPASFQNSAMVARRAYGSSSSNQTTLLPSALGLGFSEDDAPLIQHLLESDGTRPTWYPGAADSKSMGHLSFASNDLAKHFERLTLTQNMFRIYHDSMENALSCWLTQQTCPYSMVATTRNSAGNVSSLNSLGREWGPNWSNMICSRVCRLDRVFATFPGRGLTAVEDKMASRALLTAIMAFASQWATERQQRTGDLNAGGSPAEHFSRENLWNQARHALDASTRISCFRVVFANMIFSLTQRPLPLSEHISFLDSWATRSCKSRGRGVDDARVPQVDELHDLFDNDCGPVFLETAMRQLFALRYKMTRFQRTERKLSRRSSVDNGSYKSSPRSNPPSGGESAQTSSEASQSLLSAEDNETFNLLFWLGIAFDTITAAMHQRPPVVSDEDSEISCAASLYEPLAPHRANRDDIDPHSVTPDQATQKRPDMWGDLFLRKSAVGQGSNVPRWPCTYKEAAETLCDAAPVKVLFFRRVSRIQTLIYRGSGPEPLERAIQDALWVYQHWNCAYRRFILDCVLNHDSLPPRIQSWYVILAGHWHLGPMLLADILESIDRAEIGLDSQRESRRAMGLVSTLRRQNAVAVSELAYCSLRRQDPSFAKARQFHDSVNERPFLTEPWTAVLIRSFTKAGYILLNEVDVSPYAVHLPQNDPSEQARRQCEYCLDALWCLGRKSDMALLAARALASCVEGRLRERQSQPHIVVPEFVMNSNLSTVPGGYDCDIPISWTGPLF